MRKNFKFQSEGNTDFIGSSVYEFQGGMDEAMRMVLIIVKKSNLSVSLINLIVAVSILIFMLFPKFLFTYSITWSRSISLKDIMASLILFKSVVRAPCKVA